MELGRLKQVRVPTIASKTKPIIRKIAEKEGYDNAPKVFMFFSVDLESFTQFKTENKEWPLITMYFYASIVRNVDKVFQNAIVWKYIGDEVLFYIEVSEINEILEAPASLHAAMMTTQTEVQAKAKSTLHLKGALWLASVKPVNGDKLGEDVSNIYVDLPKEQYTAKNISKDFIGVDIDEGFRMSKNSSQGKLVLDPKIAFLIVKYSNRGLDKRSSDASKNAKIVGYCFMKGIWKERAYPVIWYTCDWNERNMLLYDEHITNEFARNLLYESKEVRPLKHINKIFSSTDRAKKTVADIEYVLKKAKPRMKQSFEDNS